MRGPDPRTPVAAPAEAGTRRAYSSSEGARGYAAEAADVVREAGPERRSRAVQVRERR